MNKKCSSCGVELSDDAKFCDKCGAAVPLEKNKKCYSSGTKKGKAKLVLIAFGIVLLIFFLVFSYNVSTEEYISVVRDGYLTDFSTSITVGEAFERRFEDIKWSESEDTVYEGYRHVYFDGHDPFSDTDWFISFAYDEGDTNFDVLLIQIDKESSVTDKTDIHYLLSNIYRGG